MFRLRFVVLLMLFSYTSMAQNTNWQKYLYDLTRGKDSLCMASVFITTMDVTPMCSIKWYFKERYVYDTKARWSIIIGYGGKNDTLAFLSKRYNTYNEYGHHTGYTEYINGDTSRIESFTVTNYGYDDHKRMIKSTNLQYSYGDSVTAEGRYAYDKRGNTIEEAYLFNSGKSQFTEHNTYDNCNQLMERYTTDSVNYNDWHFYSYVNGKKIKEVHTWKGHTFYRSDPDSILFEYDSLNRLTAEWAYKDTTISKTTYTYGAKKDPLDLLVLKTRMEAEKNDWVEYTLYECNEPGLPVRITHFPAKRNNKDCMVYTFDYTYY